MTPRTPPALIAFTLACAAIAQAQPASVAEAVRQNGNLERGASGSAVRTVQTALTRAGHPLTVDGEFGPRTEAAVRAFQRAEGLGVDGIVGPRTAARLDGAPAAAPPRRRGRRGAIGVLTGQPRPPGIPDARTSLTTARANAEARARASSDRTLVICFEGLWSHRRSYTERVYEYHEELRAGRRPSPPRSGSMSFLTKRLVVPNLPARHRFELVVLPETSENRDRSVGEQIVLGWHAVHGSNLRLILAGHSFGGYSALRLANKLARRGVRVDGLLTVDPRTTPSNYRQFVTPSNVDRHLNFFQKGFMPGYEMTGAVNARLRGVSHGTIPGADQVHQAYRSLLGR